MSTEGGRACRNLGGGRLGRGGGGSGIEGVMGVDFSVLIPKRTRTLGGGRRVLATGTLLEWTTLRVGGHLVESCLMWREVALCGEGVV